MRLFIRSDSPTVYVGLWNADTELVSKSWEAGRELSMKLLKVIEDLCASQSRTLEDIEGVCVYEGPGSYTGLRISISVANTFGYSYAIPVAGSSGENWVKEGLEKNSKMTEYSPISPIYGGEVHTTKPKK